MNKFGKFFAPTAASVIALLTAMPTAVQAADAAQTAQEPSLDELVVTGTRIVRDGYEAPTPLTVVDTDSLARMTATANMAETLTIMPVFSNSLNTNDGAGLPSTGNAGINSLNLRNMGTNRTLMLIDGHRVVQTLPSGVVDINTFPQQLVSRVDVVTGGASAVYGSDAVSGVVNFVLDRTYTGVKGEVSGGLTDYGDDANGKFVISGGTPFSNGRGHLLGSAEFVYKAGIPNGSGGRAWNRSGLGIMQNPAYTATNGRPEKLLRNDISLANATKGGIIVSGPLKGIAFGEGGVPYRFNYGPLVQDRLMSGGDWESTKINDVSDPLDPTERRMNAFLRASYDVADTINVYGETSWNDSRFKSVVTPQYEPGTGPTFLITNAFLPESVRQQGIALGVTSFRTGSLNFDMPFQRVATARISQRNLIGAEGTFEAGGIEWNWDSYAQYSVARSSQTVFDVLSTAKYPKAVDAVRDPATGSIVCRVTLQTGEACTPWNYFGTGVNQKGGPAEDYLFDDGHVNQRQIQKVVAASISGNPFSTWAGPVSVALSAEYRFESGKNMPNKVSQNNTLRAANYQVFRGSYNVKEAALETVVPLLGEGSDMSWEVSGAARATDYSVTGYVTTWKVGSTFAPIPDIRLRGTLSRDIRAPTLEDLFANNLLGFGAGQDPFPNTSNAAPQFLRRVLGNKNLDPEKADTLGIGAVIQPSFIPGLSFSVDYWDISLKGGINNLGDQNAINLCFQGFQQFCALIERGPSPGGGLLGPIVYMTSSPVNFSVQDLSGIDFEASYRFPLSDIVESWPGNVGFHGNATRNIKNITNPGIGVITNSVGGNGAPFWRFSATVDYTIDAFNVSLTTRAFSDGVFDRNWIECNTGCPTSTPQNRTIEVGGNQMKGAWYQDLSMNYDFVVSDANLTAFFNLRNIWGFDPVITQFDSSSFGFVSVMTNTGRYDALGRVFRAGIRFKM